MKACPKMKAVIEQLAQQHGVNLSCPEAYLRLELAGFDRLVLENIGWQRISVAHYFELNGDLVAEPDVVFFTGHAGQWFPLEITQSLTGWQCYGRLAADGSRIEAYHPTGQADLAEFAEQWAQNLVEQGWLTDAHKFVRKVVPTLQPAPQMQALMQQLMANHGVNWQAAGAYLHLEKPGVDGSLILENIGAARMSIASYLTEQGTLLPELEIVLYTANLATPQAEGATPTGWTPIESRQLYGPWRLFLAQDPNGDPVQVYDVPGQAELVRFTEAWAQQLGAEGWLEQSQPSTTPRLALTSAERWARGMNFLNPTAGDDGLRGGVVDDELDDLPF